jgi:hypothetical protein
VRVSEEASEERESGESARADREHAWGENPRTHGAIVSYLIFLKMRSSSSSSPSLSARRDKKINSLRAKEAWLRKKQNARAITPTVPATRQAIDLPKRSMNTLLSLRLRATAVAVLAV